MVLIIFLCLLWNYFFEEFYNADMYLNSIPNVRKYFYYRIQLQNSMLRVWRKP